VREGGKGIILMAHRKGPRIVSAIIDDDHVILVTRDIENRGGPEDIVYVVNMSDSLGR
jgi:hypothetical protein